MPFFRSSIGPRVSCALVLFAGTCVSTSVQAHSLSTANTETHVNAREEIQPDAQVARLLVRDAILDLGLRDTPSRADYDLASQLLSLASDLDPQNAEYARLVVEAAWAASDFEGMLNATRRVIKNDPNDTVAQLRLVSSMINKKQTLEERLALYERFLGEGGKRLSPAVRSRLALDAALLEREQGNNVGFATRLRQAIQLDISNKSAASLSAQYYGQISNDPITLLEHQIRLLFSDPLDPNVHLTICRLFAKEGAFEAAKRFLENASTLFKLDSGRAPSMIEEIRLTLKWQIEGPESIAAELDPILRDQRASAQVAIDHRIEAQLPTDDLIDPNEIRFELSVDKIRLLAAHSTGNTDGVQDVLNDIQATVNSEINAIGQAMNTRGADAALLLGRVAQVSKEFQVLRAVVGFDAAEIRKDVETLVGGVEAMRPHFESIEPMALFAEGRYQEAFDLGLTFPESPSMKLIIAQSAERIGKPEVAIDIYSNMARDHALQGIGAFARVRLEAMGYGDRTVTLAGQQMKQISKTIPIWIDTMIERPSTFVNIDISEPDRKIGSLTNPKIQIHMRNLAPVPLAVGSSQPLNSSFLLVTRIDDLSASFQGKVKSKVVKLDHRLRLMPYEEIIVEVDADSPQTQWLLEMQSNVSIRQRWRVLQGFEPRFSDAMLSSISVDSDASIYGITQSPLGLTAESRIAQRLVLPESSMSVEGLINILTTESDRESLLRAIRATSGRLLFPPKDLQLFDSEKKQLVSALMDAYTRSSNSLRAMMILQLPQRHQVSAMIDFDDLVVSSLVSDALIESKVDPVLLACALLTRTDEADSPIFDILDQVSTEQFSRLERISAIVRARLEAGVPHYGTAGPGVQGMIPADGAFIP